MEKILVAVDLSPHSLKTVEYVGKIVSGCKDIKIELFSIIKEVSRQLISDEEARRVESIFEERPEIAGRYWRRKDEDEVVKLFHRCIKKLAEFEIERGLISATFLPWKGDIATAILDEAERRNFGTIALGRRGLSVVEEFFLGSVSKSVVKEAQNVTVWVVG
jgi:nucleotide-binding universal stress UspA family protein